MTAFDWIVVAIVAGSALVGLLRGIVKELISLAAWVTGLVAAVLFAEPLGNQLPELFGVPHARYVVAFLAVFVGVLVAGGVLAWVLRRGVRAIGLGFLDRGLGTAFGVARALVLVLAFVLVVGASELAKRDWWQNALLRPWLAAGAVLLKEHLPPAWAERLDAGLGRDPAAGKTRA